MTELICNRPMIAEHPGRAEDDESMQTVLTAIGYDLSLDPTKTEKQVKQRMYEFTNVVNHLSKSLKTTPEHLTVSMVVENELMFLDYLTQSNLSEASHPVLQAARNTLLRRARDFGFSPTSFVLQDEWEPILAVLPPIHGISCIVKDAIRRRRRPRDFSDADLGVWADAALDAGRDYSHVMRARSEFLSTIRNAGLQSSLPLLDSNVRSLPGYRLRIKDMPEPLRSRITGIVDSRRAEAGIACGDPAAAHRRARLEQPLRHR